MNLVIEELENGFSTSEGYSQSILPRMSILKSQNPFAIHDKLHPCVPSGPDLLTSTLDIPASLCPMALNLHQYAYVKTITMKTRNPVSACVCIELWGSGLSVSTHRRLPENAEGGDDALVQMWYGRAC